MVGGQVSLGQPDPERLGGDVGHRGELAAQRPGELGGRFRPADHHGAQGHPGVVQREPGPGAVAPSARQRPLVAGRRPRGPPGLQAVARHLLGQCGHVRVQPPPAAGLVAAETGLADQFQAAVRLGQPDRHRHRAEPAQGLPEQRAGHGVARGRGLDRRPGQADTGHAGVCRFAGRVLMGDLGGQFGGGDAGFGGQPGELALGLGGRAAELLHQHAPGQVHDRAGRGRRAQLVQLPPLPCDQGVQPRHVGSARSGHGHQPSHQGALGHLRPGQVPRPRLLRVKFHSRASPDVTGSFRAVSPGISPPRGIWLALEGFFR